MKFSSKGYNKWWKFSCCGLLSDRSDIMTTLLPNGFCIGTIVSFKYNYLLMISYDICKNKCSRFISFFSLAIQYPDHKFSRSLYLLSILGFFPKFSFSNLSECLSKKKTALIIPSGTNFADTREDFVFSKGEWLYFATEKAKLSCNIRGESNFFQQTSHRP